MKLKDIISESRERLGLLIFNPEKLFENINKEKSYPKPIFYFAIPYIIIAVITPILETISILIRGGFFEKALNILMMPYNIILSALAAAPFAFATPFVASVMVNLGLLIFKTKVEFIKTFRIVSYSLIINLFYVFLILFINTFFGNIFDPVGFSSLIATPIIVFLGIAAIFHTLFLIIKGISFEYKISKKRAFGAIIIVPIIIIILTLLFFIITGAAIYLIVDYFLLSGRLEEFLS